jgi:PAS domain S-box-containing protein
MQRIKKKHTGIRNETIDFSKIVEQSLSANILVFKNTIVYCNGAFEFLTGYSKQELYSAETSIIPRLFSAESGELFDRLSRLCLDGGQVAYHPEMCLVRKDGIHVRIEMAVSPIEFKGRIAVHCSCVNRNERKHKKDSSLELAQFYSVGEDIIERQRIEGAMRENQEKFASIIEQVNDGVSLVDEEGYVIAWNGALELISGLKREEVLGKPHWDVVYSLTCDEHRSPEMHERIKLFHEELLTTGELKGPSVLVHRLQRPDKTRKIVHLDLFIIHTSRGHRTGVAVRDVTELVALKEALNQSEMQYRSVVETVPGMLFVIARTMGIASINGNTARFLSLSSEKIVGKKIRDVLPADAAESFEGALTRVFESGETVVQENNIGGQWIETRFVPLVETSGVVSTALAISQDITRRKTADQTLHEIGNRAEAETHRAQNKQERENDAGVFDIARLHAISGSDAQAMKRFLDLTLFTGVSMVDNIGKSIRENDLGKVVLLANGIRETALQLGATPVAEACAAVMRAARENRAEACRRMEPQLRRESESLFNALREIKV